jgi:hypothetical protein
MINSGSQTPAIHVSSDSGKEHGMTHVEITNKSVKAFYTAFKVDISVFNQKLPEMLVEFPGDYVAIYRGQIVAHNKDRGILAAETRKQHPNEFVFIERVAEHEACAVDVDSLDS